MGPVLNLALHKVSKGHDSAWNISMYGSYFTVTSFCTKLKNSLSHWHTCSCSTFYKLQNQNGAQYSDWSSTHIHKSKLYLYLKKLPDTLLSYINYDGLFTVKAHQYRYIVYLNWWHTNINYLLGIPYNFDSLFFRCQFLHRHCH